MAKFLVPSIVVALFLFALQMGGLDKTSEPETSATVACRPPDSGDVERQVPAAELRRPAARSNHGSTKDVLQDTDRPELHEPEDDQTDPVALFQEVLTQYPPGTRPAGLKEGSLRYLAERYVEFENALASVPPDHNKARRAAKWICAIRLLTEKRKQNLLYASTESASEFRVAGGLICSIGNEVFILEPGEAPLYRRLSERVLTAGERLSEADIESARAQALLAYSILRP